MKSAADNFMGKNATRDRIVDAADQLFYQHGFEHTSFAQIAKVVNISRGNFYHHFKTKDEILDAVINRRLTNTSSMLEKWELEGKSPEDRIRSFINILIKNRSKIKRYGCPVGALCSELVKLDHSAKDDANELFTLFRTWIRRQFEQLNRHDDADELAMHLLARSQGVATLASAFNDERFIKQEVKRLNEWLSQYTE
ncbi:MAG: TetR/AcrR family transcriptional regulator [Leptolyngbyaceae cyanobacterium MO_188.B28]|nr:TetR/AcrR family transcriptional regulator [Leptolyngbyaceae cyanobacterium MO_188.B28]